jgi:hypothetical protein
MTRNPEVIASSVGLVLGNALVLSGLANSWIVGNPEVIARSGLLGLLPNLPSRGHSKEGDRK